MEEVHALPSLAAEAVKEKVEEEEEKGAMFSFKLPDGSVKEAGAVKTSKKSREISSYV